MGRKKKRKNLMDFDDCCFFDIGLKAKKSNLSKNGSNRKIDFQEIKTTSVIIFLKDSNLILPWIVLDA